MKLITKEDLNSIKDMEKYYHQAMNDYKHYTRQEQNERTADIYDKYIEKCNRNFNCSICCLRIYKRVAELYFNSKKYYEAEDKKEEEKKQEQKNTKKAPVKKKK